MIMWIMKKKVMYLKIRMRVEARKWRP